MRPINNKSSRLHAGSRRQRLNKQRVPTADRENGNDVHNTSSSPASKAMPRSPTVPAKQAVSPVKQGGVSELTHQTASLNLSFGSTPRRCTTNAAGSAAMVSTPSRRAPVSPWNRSRLSSCSTLLEASPDRTVLSTSEAGELTLVPADAPGLDANNPNASVALLALESEPQEHRAHIFSTILTKIYPSSVSITPATSLEPKAKGWPAVPACCYPGAHPISGSPLQPTLRERITDFFIASPTPRVPDTRPKQ